MSTRRKSLDTEKLVYLSVFTALVIVLQCLASFAFPKIGWLELNIALIPVVLGAAFCNKWCSTWLGFLAGFIIIFSPGTVGFMNFNPPATILLVLLKGAASGFVCGMVYSLFEKKNRYLAVLFAAITAPVVNTLVFSLGCFAFFYPLVQASAKEGQSVFAAFIILFIGSNFLIELSLNILLSPTVTRLINIKKK